MGEGARSSGFPGRRGRGPALRDAAAEVAMRRLQESSARLDHRHVSPLVLQKSERPGQREGQKEEAGWKGKEGRRGGEWKVGRQGKRMIRRGMIIETRSKFYSGKFKAESVSYSIR